MTVSRKDSGSKTGPKRARVKSAARVLDIFELLLTERDGLSLSELSERLQLPASSAHALVQTLVGRGYLVRDAHRLIRLGPKLGQYARVFTNGLDLIGTADSVMEQVAQVCSHTVSLGVLEGADIVFVHKRIAAGMLHVVNPVGTRLPAHATSLGKAILALLSASDLAQLYPAESVLEDLTPNTITNPATLFAGLESVRRSGTAYDREESALGIFAVGAAIQDHRDEPVAAVSIVLPAAQADEVLQSRCAAVILSAAKLISYRLGCALPDMAGVDCHDLIAGVWQQDGGV